MLYDFPLWKDEHQEALIAFQASAIDRLMALGAKVGMQKRRLLELQRQREELSEARTKWATEIRCEFGFERSDSSSWWNEVRVEIEIKDDYRVRRGKEEGRRFSPAVRCKPHSNSEVPADAARFGAMLVEVGSLCVQLETELDLLLRRIGNEPECPAKVQEDDARRDRRTFVSCNVDGPKVRCFVEELIKVHFIEGNHVKEAVSIRYEGKERRLLNQVSEEVLKVSHERGGPSTIKLTPKARGYAEQFIEDEAARG